MYIIKGILLQCVDPVSCITSRCLCNAVSRYARPPVSRDTALHKQLEVIQPSGSTHCSGILYNQNKTRREKEYYLSIKHETKKYYLSNFFQMCRDDHKETVRESNHDISISIPEIHE